MRFFTNKSELIRMGSEYLRFVGISYLLSAVSQVYLTFMKNCNAVNLSTIISSMTVVLNIVFNAVFIFGLFGAAAMGIRGAALATLLATAIQMNWYGAVVLPCTALSWGIWETMRWQQTALHTFPKILWCACATGLAFAVMRLRCGALQFL
ncbi:MATE family efflux transporter [Parablautia intestinalis]|uniref:MATE family efflux transporter n=1 Tax=Parablautia intestinalis TaxID=2320100 RepID=UPI002ECFC548